MTTTRCKVRKNEKAIKQTYMYVYIEYIFQKNDQVWKNNISSKHVSNGSNSRSFTDVDTSGLRRIDLNRSLTLSG